MTKKLRLFLLVFVVYNVLSLAPLIFYGPFKGVTDMVVGSIATSRHPQVLKLFYPEARVRQIMAEVGSGSLAEAGIGGSNLKLGKFSDNTVEIKDVTGAHFNGKMLLVHNPMMVQVVTTKDLNVAGEKTSDMAKRVGAIAAINGGGFLDPNGKGNGGFPQGITIHNGQIITGANSNSSYEIIGVDKNGVLIIGWFKLSSLKAMGMREAVSFGPQIIKNGKGLVKGNGGWGIAPRTAIAQKSDGTIIFLTIDGRQINSIGATLKEVQNLLIEEGAYNAANLDGGSSTTMFYQGQVVNTPANPFGERYVPTAFTVMPIK